MTIRILPPRLANQIAAGEVVERPASVIKELVENSLDAGATQLEITVLQGGHKRILVRDNGSGISKDELQLALSRHATSKVAHLDDIESIATLGFRGEALASISSVSRLTLTSKTAEQDEAWLAYAEGREMDVQIKPAAHPTGTSIEVSDLFFNTPARRKFLRAEKTEFHHIDELIKRLAMARFDVGFRLIHNGKVVRNLPACQQERAQLKRIGSICGGNFSRQALHMSSESSTLQVEGWLLPAAECSQQSPPQYTFINGRMIRDKVLTHAIRQAYANHLRDLSLSAYALYLTLPFTDVDVNVHPAKHEVRFSESRLVHDFVVQAVDKALQSQAALLSEQQQRELAPVDEQTGELFISTAESSTVSHETTVQDATAALASKDLASVNPRSLGESSSGESPADETSEGSRSAGMSSARATTTANAASTTRSAAASATYPHQQTHSSRELQEQKPSKQHWQSYDALMSPSLQERQLASMATAIPTPSKAAVAPAQPLYPYQCIAPHHSILLKEEGIWLLDVLAAEQFFAENLHPLPWKAQPLLLPLSVPMSAEQSKEWQPLVAAGAAFGIDIHLHGTTKLIIRQLPALLRQGDLTQKLTLLQSALSHSDAAQQRQALLALAYNEHDWHQRAAPVVAQLVEHSQPATWLKLLAPEQLVALMQTQHS